jgi:hypothetical protein
MARPMPIDLLRDVAAWKATGPDLEGEEFGVLSYLCFVATPDLLFAFAELLAPELVMHEGSYFIAERFSVANYEEWRARLEDARDIERVMNHLHISTLFQDQDVPDALAVAAAALIAGAWTRGFTSIGVVGEAYGDTFATAEVTLLRAPSSAQ